MDVKVSSKYQIVIPKAIRRRFQLKPGDKLNVVAKKDTISIAKIPPVSKQLDKLLRMTPPTRTDAVNRVRKLRDEEWN